MRSAIFSFALTFAATAALLQTGLLPSAWGNGAPESGFEERHADENKAEIEAQLRLTRA